MEFKNRNTSLSIEEDKLGFASFANNISKGIENYKSKEPYVLSIEGAWGSGKSVFLDFII